MNDRLRLSVALVTRNRPDSLRRCLESLRAQGEQPFEVIVSDDSDSQFREENQKVAVEFNSRHVTGPRNGLYANRNFAALQCTGSHIRTMDDDHTFPEDHFARCVDAVRSDGRAIWTTGEIGYVDGKFHAESETATQLHPSGVGGPVEDPDDNWAIADGSTIYPREVFERGYRMVEDFAYGSSYLEFGAYLRLRGYRSRCVRGAKVEHHADVETLQRQCPESVLFASLCYNLFFRPDPLLAARYILPSLCRRPSLARALPLLLKKSRLRWAG